MYLVARKQALWSLMLFFKIIGMIAMGYLSSNLSEKCQKSVFSVPQRRKSNHWQYFFTNISFASILQVSGEILIGGKLELHNQKRLCKTSCKLEIYAETVPL